ncbi:MAG TPA: hypothetical protein VFJ02_02440 [Vicinamibacterales bacterium]|nr:hypothetical protein [Vicinamibacterales bacterium]
MCALVATVVVPVAHAQAADAATGVYVVTFRTSAHVRTSSGEVFHNAAADTRRLLAECGVTIVADPERGFIENESRMSVASMTRLAREAGATSLLLVIVDRPFTEWIKITLQAYDLDGTLLWEDKAGSGMGGVTGSHGYRKCFEKLEKIIGERAGGPGLPAGHRRGSSGE